MASEATTSYQASAFSDDDAEVSCDTVLSYVVFVANFGT